MIYSWPGFERRYKNLSLQQRDRVDANKSLSNRQRR